MTQIIFIIIGILIGAGVVLLIIKFRKKPVPNVKQQKQKQENLDKVMELARERGEIKNDDVEKSLGVSDATATNYLDELEKQGKLEQVGGTGRFVRYRLK